VFLLGVDALDRYNVSLEQEEYGDLLQGDFIEGHYNLSLKDNLFLDYVEGNDLIFFYYLNYFN